ncbi:MAG: ClbS/DfsB family four-helix bundle protein [Anaerolineae bacterium]
MNMQEHILAAAREQFDQWEIVLVAMGEAQILTQPRPNEWSTKDVVTHLWAWQQRSNARLETSLTLQPPAYPDWPAAVNPDTYDDVDVTNAWLYETYRALPWATVYRQWREGYLRFIELGGAVPQRTFLSTDEFPWLRGYSLANTLVASYDHHVEHMDDLLAWLQAK